MTGFMTNDKGDRRRAGHSRMNDGDGGSIRDELMVE